MRIFKAFLALALLCGSPTWAAITAGNSIAATATSSTSTPITFSFNNNGDTVKVDIGNFEPAGQAVTGVTYNGVSMSLVYKSACTGAPLCDYSFLLTNGQGAASGTNNVVITLAGTPSLVVAIATAYTGVNQTSPNRAPFSTFSNADNNPTLAGGSITQTSGDLVVGSAYNFCTAQTSAASPQVNEQTQALSGSVVFSADHNPSTGATGLSWTGGGSCNTQWAAGAYALVPAATTPSTAYLRSVVTTLVKAGNAFLLATTTTPPPVVTINVTPSTILLGASATLTWSATNATSCTASGAWSGSKATSGSTSVTPGSGGSFTYTLTCTGTGGTGFNSATLTVNTTAITFPRLFNSSYSSNSCSIPMQAPFCPAAPANIAYGQHMDMYELIDDYEGAAASNGYNRASVVNGIIAGDGVIVPKVVQYVLDSYVDSNVGTPPNVGQNGAIWGAQMNAMPNWYAWRPDIAPGTRASMFGSPPNIWQYNPYDGGPAFEDMNGNNVEGAFALYSDNLFRTGSTSDAAPNLSGPWHDNIFSIYPADVVANWLGTGPNTCTGGGCPFPSQSVTVAPSLRTGISKFFSWYRMHASGQFIGGNVAVLDPQSDMPGVPMYHRPPSDIGPLNGTLDYAMAESAWGYNPPDQASTEHFSGLNETRILIQYMDSITIHPEYNQYASENTMDTNGSDPDSPGTGQAFRYGFCGSVVFGQGMYAPISWLVQWFDYYAVDPATGISLSYGGSTSGQIAAARKWLGTAIDGPQTSPIMGHTTYARRFRMPNGRTALVLENPSCRGGFGCGVDTINLTSTFGGTWTHVTASGTNSGSNAMIDTGGTTGSVSVPIGDGQILLQAFYLLALPRRRKAANDDDFELRKAA